MDSVEYHRATVLGRGDDHPGQALGYYAARGETPLRWGGGGAQALGLVGAVTDSQYESIYGIGGASDPTTGERLVETTRPGMELVISAHKSVAELGVVGRAEHMHAIMDAEFEATLAYLDELTQRMGGRRGKHNERTPTEGLVYATTRHATSRAADPCPHDHVLLANLVRMDDEVGGWKGADTALWRQHLHAATVAGRVASARKAVELAYAIVPDPGPSGRLGHWAIAGIPEVVMDTHSKRAAAIEAEMQRTGNTSYQARNIAARATRDSKRHTAVSELMPQWIAEIGDAGWSVPAVIAAVEHEARSQPAPAPHLSGRELRTIAAEVLAADGPLAARKVFTRRDAVVAIAPYIYGRDPDQLGRAVDRALADPEAVPLLRAVGASERAYATAATIAREEAIARAVDAQARRTQAAAVTNEVAVVAARRAEAELGRRLTEGQRAAVGGVLTSGRGVELVVGVAGSGKTTALAVCRDAFEAGGYAVIGTSTSGQAARTLAQEAGIEPSRTLASLNWRIGHDQLRLTPQHVAILDEAAMTDDASLLAFLEATRAAGTKVVMVGDHRQLGAVGPGGGFDALIRRYGAAVHVLDENVRQVDSRERAALAQLRAGKAERAVSWYVSHGRVAVHPDRDAAIDATVAGWAADVAEGTNAAMYAWRRANVAELNRRGREAWTMMGRLSGPELLVGSTPYRAGDRIVTLAPGGRGQIVTSEHGTVVAVDVARRELGATMDDGRFQRFAGDDLDGGHLTYGYAVTVHRSQGSTVERAHTLEDGGGRELAYVKMSRARERSTVYVVADNVDQAADDLRWSWSQSKRIGWAIDQGAPDPGGPRREREPAGVSSSVRHARLVAERDALAAMIPNDPGFYVHWVENDVGRLKRQLKDLDAVEGWSELRGTPVGDAAIAFQRAATEQRACLAQAEHARLRDRPGLRARARRAGDLKAPLRAEFERLAVPERARITAELPEAERELKELQGQERAYRRFSREHPEAFRRLEHLDRQIEQAAYGLDLEREGLDGIEATPPQRAGVDRDLGREPPGLDRGIDFGIGR